MPNVCCVKGCRSGIEETEDTVTFHSFPTNEENRAEWAAALGDVTWEPSESDLVCSLHFESSDYMIDEFGEPLELIAEAVPSLHLQISDEMTEELQRLDTLPADKANVTKACNSEELSKNADMDDLEDIEKPNEDKYAYLARLVEVDKDAPRDELLDQFNKAYMERQILRKKMKMLKRKNVRTIEKIAKACEKKDSGSHREDIVNESDLKKKKKSDLYSKLCAVNLEEVLTYLETQDLLSCKAISVLRAFLNHALLETIHHEPRGSANKDKDKEPTPVMKTFAKTLLFYSAEAYHMVKELYELPMPAPSVCRTWYNMGLGLPGWSSEAFLLLKDEIQKCETSILHTCVVIGELDLSAASLFEDQEVRGHIDYGTTGDLEIQNSAENLPLAQSALFFMLKPMDSNLTWKIPLAYFLIETLSPDERANIVMECLWRVYNMGSVVVAIVLDASINSRQTVESLGIAFEELPYPSTSFPHPADGLLDVHVVFDSSHILELMRHTWASVSLMVDEKGGAISWKYFTELVKVQETQAGSSEQADQTATWYWDKSMMRKRLIAQLFTNDVADAIECCCKTLMLSQFTGSESTVFFIRTIYKIFEIFNSSHILASQGRSSEWKKNIVEALNYLFVLRDRTGQGIFATNCKAPFVCLYMNLITFMELSKNIAPKALAGLSLDGLELLFVGIRCKTNWEEFPSVSKFVNSYSLLLQEEGCAFSDGIVKVDSFWWLDCHDVSTARRSGLEILKPVIKIENTPILPKALTFYPILLQNELQRFRASQLILVHAIKRVADVLICQFCIEGLQMYYVQDNPTLILLRKTCGGFVYPSQGVVEVCKLADHHLKTLLRSASYELKLDVFTRRDNALIQSVCVSVMESLLNGQKNPFPQLDDHRMKCPVGSDHVCRLIRLLTASYVLLKLQSQRAWACHQS